MDKEKMRQTISKHVRELEKINEAFASAPDTDPIKLRLKARLEEAREAARKVEETIRSNPLNEGLSGGRLVDAQIADIGAEREGLDPNP